MFSVLIHSIIFLNHSLCHCTKMAQPDHAQLALIGMDKISSQHQRQPPQHTNSISVASQASRQRLTPKLPLQNLIKGPREKYLKIGVPLYEASISCNWKAAKLILDTDRELVRHSITDHGETALHVAASAEGDPKRVVEFVRKLVNLMEEKDLELENENFNTAMYLAAVAGNVETVKIMVQKNRSLLTIPGAGGKMLPLYAAALFGNYAVVKYLYKNSNDLSDEVWTDENRRWLLEKCVENDMFDIALQIVKNYRKLGTETGVLGILAGKPEAFPDIQSSIIEKPIKLIKGLYSRMFTTHQQPENNNPEPDNASVDENLDQNPEASHEARSNVIGRCIKSVYAFIGAKVKKENKALSLLKIIWEDVAKKNKKEIDKILRGPQDPPKQDKSASGRVIQAIQLQKLINEHLRKMEEETTQIINGQVDLTTQVTNPSSANMDHAQQLHELISKYLVNLQIASQEIIKQSKALVVDRGDQAPDLQKLISEHIVNMYRERDNVYKQSTRENLTTELQNLISGYIARMRGATKQRVATTLKEATASKVSYSSRVIFIAARTGNTNFLVELIRQYPDLIWKINDNGLTIFHIAVKYRHEGIYNLLYEIGAMKDLITPIKDEQGNTMLHLVGTRAKQKQLEDVSGVALQMQRELLWFQEVKKMIPPAYRERKNKDDLTPHELFTLDHKELVKQGEEWMRGTASQCMVVATLIATIVFAAAFTVPGGYAQTDDKNNGIPVFHSKATFIVFVVADAISLFTSSASILIFLSILTSRYAENDFLKSLPIKLVSGLLTLFLSITTMTVVFGVSFFVLYHKGLIWMPILICVLGLLPVILYICLQLDLFFDVFRSTYRSRYLFKPKKRVLYYQNPTV
ncbi:hypothetical protein QVD17_37044 [Tagetes erecta]|uniref:PGG domain-containing protein n=1 Tax=Tagetes erecta TaxID=13708 RepID=A0AAD8NIU6_TARER|nr:hypothetical protein QVD17_37044 [Tagetes erecta]